MDTLLWYVTVIGLSGVQIALIEVTLSAVWHANEANGLIELSDNKLSDSGKSEFF